MYTTTLCKLGLSMKIGDEHVYVKYHNHRKLLTVTLLMSEKKCKSIPSNVMITLFPPLSVASEIVSGLPFHKLEMTCRERVVCLIWLWR